MRLPPENAAFERRVSYGRYVARRLRRHGSAQAADDLQQQNAELRRLGRTWEEAEDAVQDALAERDAADDALDTSAREVRLALASRGLGADKQEPYTRIFPDGITHYTAAPWGQNSARYAILVERLKAHLPEGDPVRAQYADRIATQAAAFIAAEQGLTQARARKDEAMRDLNSAEKRWGKNVERLYGGLVQELGKAQAEGFFPKARAQASSAEEDPSA
jgi:hypothetical protein